MKKLFGFRGLAAVIGVSAIFASVGFADSFKINGDRINDPDKIYNAEGAALIASCDDNVKVEKIDVWDDDNGVGNSGWVVDKIKVSHINDKCRGLYLTVALTDKDGHLIPGTEITESIAGDTVYVQYSPPPGNFVEIKDLHDLHVLISELPPS